MAALCIYARDNISVTDVQCKWNIRRERNEDNIEIWQDLYPLERPYNG